MAETFADLRARLKQAGAKKSDSIPYRTCVDIIVKMNRDKLFGDDLVFTTDGLDVMTKNVLDVEITETITAQGGRVRISALSRELAVAEETVADRCRKIPRIVVYLNDAIVAEWFVDKANELERWLKRDGEIKLTAICERFSLSLELVSSRILPLVKTCERTVHGISSEAFSDIIAARVRGVARALKVPQSVQWIAEQVQSPTVETLNDKLTAIRHLGCVKDGIFTPTVWLETQVEEALQSWRTKSWCSLASLRLKIGSGKAELRHWLESEGLEDGVNCGVFNSTVVRVADDLILPLAAQFTATTPWINISSRIGDRLKFPADVDVSAVAKFVKLNSPSLTRWRQAGPVLFRDDLISRLVEDTVASDASDDVRSVVKDRMFYELGIQPETCPAYALLIAELDGVVASIEAERNHVKTHSEIESDIVTLYWQIISDAAAINSLGGPEILFKELLETSVRHVVTLGFEMVASRFCGAAKVSVATAEEREAVIKSVSVPGVKEGLRSLTSIVDTPPEYVHNLITSEKLKMLLGEITVVISKPEKRKLNVSQLLTEITGEMETAVGSQKIGFVALKAVMTKLAGARICCLRSDRVIPQLDVLVHALSDRMPNDLSALFLSSDDDPTLVSAVKDFIRN